MHIKKLENDNYLVYLNNSFVETIPLTDKKPLAKYFKDLLKKLKNNYHLDIHGYYEIEIHADYNYGLIIELNKISDDYFDLFNSKVDVRIIYHKPASFLYEVDDYDVKEQFKKNNYQLYYLNDKYYFLFYNLLSNHHKDILLENAKIYYGQEKQQILNSAVNIMQK